MKTLHTLVTEAKLVASVSMAMVLAPHTRITGIQVRGTRLKAGDKPIHGNRCMAFWKKFRIARLGPVFGAQSRNPSKRRIPRTLTIATPAAFRRTTACAVAIGLTGPNRNFNCGNRPSPPREQ